MAAAAPAQRDRAGRVLDLLMDGLRYRASADSPPRFMILKTLSVT